MLAHQDLQVRGNGVVEGGWLVAVVLAVDEDRVVVTEVAAAVVVAVLPAVVVAHGRQPPQQSHVHLNDQLSELCAQKGLHSPRLSVLLVVVVSGGGVVVAGTVVGGVPGTHCA